jgi:hypothetical protein
LNETDPEFSEDLITRSFHGLALVVIVVLIMIAKHFLPVGHDLAIFGVAIPVTLISWAFITARVRGHFQRWGP